MLYIKTLEGIYEEANVEYVVEQALKQLESNVRGCVLNNPKKVESFLRLKYGTNPIETFGAIILDNALQVVDLIEFSTGTVDFCAVHPREIVKRLINTEANTVMLFHNHPSGGNTFSEADKTITIKLKKALELIDVKVIDHLLVTDTALTSMNEIGVCF